jgi:SAM-dependent methyltransferase
METPQQTVVRYRRVLSQKHVLRETYLAWYSRMTALFADAGPTVEIGTGHGLMADVAPGLITSDVFPSPYTRLASDAMYLPFETGSVGNFAMLDVLHHIERPVRAFAEFARCLQPGGRLVVAEPYLSPVARLLFRFHFEPVDFDQQLGDASAPPNPGDSDPFDGNMALSHKALVTETDRLLEQVPDLRLVGREISDHLVYPLCGGFNFPSLVPRWGAPALRALERYTRFMAPIAGFRIIAAFEKPREA